MQSWDAQQSAWMAQKNSVAARALNAYYNIPNDHNKCPYFFYFHGASYTRENKDIYMYI